jgi:hypothetical protein
MMHSRVMYPCTTLYIYTACPKNATLLKGNRIKSRVKYQEKMMKKMFINDGLRYTIVSDRKDYWDVCNNVIQTVTKDNPRCVCKNHWKSMRPYNGFHIDVRSKLCNYEIQIHTPKSLEYRDDSCNKILYELAKENVFARVVTAPIMHLQSIPVLLDKPC